MYEGECVERENTKHFNLINNEILPAKSNSTFIIEINMLFIHKFKFFSFFGSFAGSDMVTTAVVVKKGSKSN